MKERVVLTFDIGTQSARAMLINNSGDVICKKQIKYELPYFSRKLGWAEQEADFYYEHIALCSRQLKESEPKKWELIEAVTITTIRDTSVCVDENGSPLRPSILWLDKRMAVGRAKLSKPSRALLKAVGMDKTADLQFQKSHCNWIKQNQPDIWEKTYKFLMLSAYLTFKLTGNFVDAAAAQVGHIPFDVKRREWMKPFAFVRPVFNIPIEKLCKIADTGDIMGYITQKAALDTGIKSGIPVIATGSDKACESIGLGCVNKTQAAIGFGTTATITLNIDTYMEAEKYMSPYPSIIKGSYSPEFEIFRGYWLISWYKKEFAEKEVKEAERLGISAEELLNKRLGDIAPGCDGLFFQPYFTPNITMPVARGALIGLTEHHSRIHVYRAIIEGINFGLLEGLREIEYRGKFKFEEIHLGGGGSQSSEICQIASDMFGLPVVRIHTHETSGLGSAIAGFVGIGVFNNFKEAVDSMVFIKDRYEPNIEKHKLYKQLYEQIYRHVYGNLSPLYRKLKDILDKN